MDLLYSLIFMLSEMAPYILLGFLIAGVMHAFIPQRTFARHLSGSGWKPVVKAAAVGVPLPLCSCGVLPTAIAMRRNGASRAASTSFLVSTPQTGADSIAATWSLLGPAFAIIRPIAALTTAVFGGLAVGKVEKCDNVVERVEVISAQEPAKRTFGRKLVDALRYGYLDLVSSIGGWLVVGLVIAALITVYVPADFFSFLGRNPILSMLAVLVVAIPMYVCATGSIPIALSLMLKGLSPGTALVLLMAGPAANFASFTLISREMGRKAAAIYLASIVVGAIAFGLAIDYLMPRSWFAITDGSHMAHACHHLNTFALICSGVLVVVLIIAFIRRFLPQHKINNITMEYIVKGMNCPHCQASVTKSIAAVPGVTAVEVNLSTGVARVEGVHNPEEVKRAVRAAGFDID